MIGLDSCNTERSSHENAYTLQVISIVHGRASGRIVELDTELRADIMIFCLLRVLRPHRVVLLDITITFPGVSEPDIGSLFGCEVLNVRGEFARFLFESESSAYFRTNEAVWNRSSERAQVGVFSAAN